MFIHGERIKIHTFLYLIFISANFQNALFLDFWISPSQVPNSGVCCSPILQFISSFNIVFSNEISSKKGQINYRERGGKQSPAVIYYVLALICAHLDNRGGLLKYVCLKNGWTYKERWWKVLIWDTMYALKMVRISCLCSEG